ncbi:GA-like domain-containing protein [Staphylococcus arlettae]|uniref:GA-like domain-containing protein n=9 Tax=Staphylococcus TaxID=1279 RepID=UPI001CA7661C|nr:YSIRK-type signal peptide-containing protein [Staphylococcus arlettae]QZZ04470.1 YSIRK-type signal peptide-containing protein [Staphylococcus arlettae]
MNNNKKVQKYSIRKYSVGAASILIGTLLFLNPSTAEAQELEPKSNETTTKENEELSQGNDVTNTDEVQEQELPAEVNTSQKTDEPSDVEEISSQEEKAQKLDEAEAQEVTSEENKVQSTDESKNKKEVTRQKSNEQNADEAPEQEVNTQVNQFRNLDEATDEEKAPLEEKEVQKSDNEQTQKVNELQNIDELKGKKEVSSQNKATQKTGGKNEQEFTPEVKQQLNNDNSIEEVTQEVKEAQKISEAPNQKVKLNIKSTPLKRNKRQLPELPPSNTDIPVVPLQNRAASHTFSPRSVSSSYQARYFSSMRGFNDITTNSTRRDAIEIIEKHKQHLTEKEREFYLRNIARKLNLPKNEKTWNNLFRNSIDNKLIGRKVAKNQVNDVNKVLESMKNLINNRQGNFYTEISNNNVKKITANDLRYVSTEKRGGKYVVSFDLTKELGSGVKRFETLSLKVNDSLNSKIEKVLVDYIPHKGLAEATKTLNRDKLGYYSFTTEPKNKAGASATFKLVLKSATEIDSAKDQIGVQLISDTNYPNPVHGVNLELKTVNMKPIAQKVNSDIKKIKEQEAKGQVQPPVDNQAKDEATKAVVEAEQAEQAAKDKLTKANEDGVINPNEHKELEEASNQADTKKKAAEAKVNALSENQKGDLPQRLDKLTGIDIPGINDKDSNGVADNIDKAKDEATKAIEEAEQADKVAKEAFTKANEDGVINPKEHQELEAASKKAKETKVAAEDKVKALPESQKGDLPQRLEVLTGIAVPDINDQDSNGIADNIDKANAEATKAVEAAEQADKVAKEALTKANEDGVINPNEHKELEAASNQADTKKKEAEAKVNALSENQKGDLPQRLDKLTGIDIPGINDKDSNGVADNIDKAKDEATKAIEEAEQADKVAKEAFTKANEDGVINPKEHQELEAASKKAKETKVAAEDKVKALPENQKVNLPQRLDKLTGIDVPNINDKDSNGVADDLDQAKDEATKAVEEAERADKEAKEKLANANKDGVINPNEHQELVAASKQAKETKAAAEAKVNALSESQKGDLPQRLSKLTGIDIPGINDKDSNGVADDLDQAKDEATKAVVEAERADKVAKDKLTKANEDGVINPNEHQELEEASKKAKETKAAAEAKVKALPENQKGELPQRLEVLTGIDVPNINDQDSNGVVNDLDQANDEAMKAVEEAEKADKVAKEKLAKAVEDGAINPKEHQELTEEANQAETKKKAASEKVNKLPKDKQDNLQERLDKLTGIKVPNVNDQDSNGLADELDGTLADVAKAVEAAKQADKSAIEALAKAKEDGKISQEEVNKLTELANQAKETKANAEVLVEELPETPKQLREKKAEFNEVLAQLTGITVPTVTDNVIPGQQDNMDQARADATKAVEEAERADKMAKEKLTKAVEDGVINPKEHQELVDLTQQAETKKKEAVAKVNALPESQKADLPQRLGKLIGIDIPNINDQDNNNLPDELDGTLADVAMAVEKAKQVAKAAKEALAKAKEDGKISQEEVNKLMDLAKLARETKATAKVLVEELPETPKQLKAKKAEFNEELAQLTGIVVPTVTSNVVPGQQDNMNQATVEASQAVEEAERADKMAKEKLANANKDGVINPKEHQELEEASKKAKETKATAEAKVNALPEKQKEEMPQRLEALTGINVPGINDKDSNGVADDLDQAKAEAMQAVEEAERADNMAKEKLAKAVEDGAINPKEHQELEEASKKAKETKATAETKVNALPESQKGDLPESLDKLTGIDIPNINDQESNGLADELDGTLIDVTKAVEAAKQVDKAAKEALAKAKEDGKISQEEVNKLTDLAKQAKETKVTAEVLVKELPETPKQLKEKKAEFNEVLGQLTGIVVPTVTSNVVPGQQDNMNQAKAEAMKVVEEAERADKVAKDKLTKAKADGAINPKEYQELEEASKKAKEIKATAETKVNALPESQKGDLPQRLDKLTGIDIPNINDQDSNGLADELDDTLADVAKAVEAAKQADAKAKEALVKANTDGKISQEEVNKLTDLAKLARETKATAEVLVEELPETPKQLKEKKAAFNEELAQLTGIVVPTVTSNVIPGQQDNMNQATAEASQAVEEAERADKMAKEKLANANKDGVINPKEHQELEEASKKAKETKATAEAKVNALPEKQKEKMPQRLEALTGINVPGINDKDSNGVADDLDQAKAEAMQAVEEAEQADKAAKEALAKANEDGKISQEEVNKLMDLAQQAKATKATAEAKVNALSESQKGDLPQRLEALTGINVPVINDKNSNGVANDLDQATADATQAVEEAEQADKVAKAALAKANEDGVINPKEHQDLIDLAQQAEATKKVASEKVNVLPQDKQVNLQERLDKLTGIKVPNVNSDVLPTAPSEDDKEMKPEVSGEDGNETTPTASSKAGKVMTPEESSKGDKITVSNASNENSKVMKPEVSGEDSKETIPTILSEDGNEVTSEESGKTNKLTTPTASIEDVNKVTLEESSKDDKETSSTVTSEVIAPKALSKDGKAMSSENLKNNSNNTINELPKTGNDGINSYIYTGVLALFGSLLLFVRRRKNKSN